MSDAPTTDSAKTPGTRSKGELVLDIVIVLAVGGYLLVARSYPPIGRQIPTVVGIVTLVAALVQLVGWFVPGMWKFSHGAPKPTATTGIAAGDEPPAPDAEAKPVDVPVAMAWAGGFLGAILLVGYVIAVPLFFLVYFGVRRSWLLAIVSAVVMGVVARVLFETVLTIPLYGGILF